jgi:hypothetical protein
MSSNDRIILDEVLTQIKAERAPSLTQSEFFEVFAAEQALKEYDLSYEEIEGGIVGDGGDGGIDGVFVFANGDLVHEDSDLSGLKKGVTLDLVVIQAKTSPSFSELAIDRLVAVTDEVLDLSRGLEVLAATYNDSLISAVRTFRHAHNSLAARFPHVRITYVYASKGEDIHPNVRRKADKLEERSRTLFSGAEVSVVFLGVKELLALARRAPATSHSLVLAESPISSSGDVGFVCLVRLRDYFAFITENGSLLRGLFESNVRDYAGATQVNDQIQESLVQAGKEDFWWLNNGITIVASKAAQSGKALTIEDPQIVNGLQSSTEIFNYFKSGKGAADTRNLLVRVIVPTDPASRDRIIKATNSQTYIPPASLRATDKIHRDIEDHLKARGYYYDRRKNHYKNEGIALEKIISIPYMAQAVMSVALQRPDNARSRPSSLLKKDEDYKSLFSDSMPIALYGFCGGLVKRIEALMRIRAVLSQKDRGNIRFHSAMYAAALATARLEPKVAQLAALDLHTIPDSLIEEAIDEAYKLFQSLGGTDSIAKASEFVSALRESLKGRGLK